MKRLMLALGCAAMLALSGCAYYGPPPGYYPAATPASFDRSFSAAAGAMRDQGVAVNVEDRASGNVVGRIDGGTVTASVRQQADGSVRVQFDSQGARDPALLDRISQSYDRRMGR